MYLFIYLVIYSIIYLSIYLFIYFLKHLRELMELYVLRIFWALVLTYSVIKPKNGNLKECSDKTLSIF